MPSFLAKSIESCTIRFCNTFEDYDKCIELQRLVWNSVDLELTSARIYIISWNAGGFLLGAFTPEEELVGFLHTFPAHDENNEAIYYSHMLAIKPEWQNSGLGQMLKLRQREQALERGIRLIVWTFDPLQSRNAHFNINKLGCVTRKYKVNLYGTATSSVFDEGIEADRLLAEWWVRSPRVESVVANQSITIPTDWPFVEIPYDFAAVRSQDLAQARQWRYHVRSEFEKMFADGLICAGFQPGTSDRFSRYYFTDPEQLNLQ
ncbi:MAG: GNAT family N-acetyltransferase [Acidobacteriota bacterium]